MFDQTTNNKDQPYKWPMPLITPRLIIRPAMPEDAHILHQAKIESFTDLNKWMIWAKEKGSVEQTELNIRKAYAKFILQEEMDLMLAFSRSSYDKTNKANHFIAATGLHAFKKDIAEVSVGYWVRTKEQNKGYATEAATSMIRYAFDALKAKRVRIAHSAGNHASQRVIEKLGFQHESTAVKGNLLPDDTYVDEHAYAMLSPDPLPSLDIRWGEP